MFIRNPLPKNNNAKTSKAEQLKWYDFEILSLLNDKQHNALSYYQDKTFQNQILKISITNMFALLNFLPFSQPLTDIPLDDTAQ